jgi:hypothetical protein
LANAALITAAVVNVNRGKGKRALTIEDIIGKDDAQYTQKEPRPEELLTLMQALHKKHGKKGNVI